MSRMILLLLFATGLVLSAGCVDGPSKPEQTLPDQPECPKTSLSRTDAHTPQSVVSDWSEPVRLGSSGTLLSFPALSLEKTQ